MFEPAAALSSSRLDRGEFKSAILAKLIYQVGKDPKTATRHDWFVALALAVRDRLVDGWMATTRRTYEADKKRVYYLSLEFLIGRLLADSLRNLGLHEVATAALSELGVDAEQVFKVEPDAALGNGGLGRLAACLLDSMATLGIAAYGYGIRYEHGLFKQGFDDGWQVERPEDWLAFGNPWEFERAEAIYPVRFYGHVREERDASGRRVHRWEGGQRVLAVAYDTPVVGWGGTHINTLRLWSAQSGNLIDLEAFNRGDYMRAVQDQVLSQSISRVLYPNDATEAGQELRLKQEYFFTSASLQDILRRHLSYHPSLASLPDKVAIQLNDTHPAIAVPELMRLLIDEHGLGWDEAWAITRGTIHYTNHTLMPEALERWPVPLVERLLPRHLQLVYEINAHVLSELRARPDNPDPHLAEVSIIDEGYGRSVRMGHLAFLGARRVNGVSALHGELMKETVFRPLHRYFPDRITAITNGVTPRRWLLDCNPELARLISEALGETRWLTALERLEGLVPLAADAAFRERFAAIKRANKARIAAFVARRHDLVLPPEALLDLQIKRIHEYKRQLLNILEAVAAYAEMLDRPDMDYRPRVKIFAGKAAPSYLRAKLIIKLVNDVAAVINQAPVVKGRLKILFLPNYNVSLAEILIPGADLSEQISTAGMEASGTGNMKLALNGALTIGTLDGANIEMRERVGPENIFIFGLTAAQVAARRQNGPAPAEAIAASPRLQRALALIESGHFSPDDPGRFRPLLDDLARFDHFMVTADFDAYASAQRRVAEAYGEPALWWRKAVLNTARMGWFSSDRTVRDYAREIWQVPLGG
ncbi:glycogen/starch/alpha-glucan phosphorylase [Benzoatithermus flavus]|uniref:Alpha-1,4 glucan phosphorylase n=1 Tax=Benzoatithermus flavus TaxID=3108223 RepID=A0ABU8XWU7_9PROT